MRAQWSADVPKQGPQPTTLTGAFSQTLHAQTLLRWPQERCASCALLLRAPWLRQRRDMLLAGIVGFLGGKLRDYREHYGSEPEELAACVALWQRYAPPLPLPQQLRQPQLQQLRRQHQQHQQHH